MSDLQFPKNPVVGQQYDFTPYKYYWDGTKWKTMGIGYNPVNDLRNEVEPRIGILENNIEDLATQSFEALRRSYAEAGLNLVDGSFEEGLVFFLGKNAPYGGADSDQAADDDFNLGCVNPSVRCQNGTDSDKDLPEDSFENFDCHAVPLFKL